MLWSRGTAENSSSVKKSDSFLKKEKVMAEVVII